MPRNFSELKSGGTIPMLSPQPEKWGGGDARPPRPPPIDARVNMHFAYCGRYFCGNIYLL